jgi:hypothetical protein
MNEKAERELRGTELESELKLGAAVTVARYLADNLGEPTLKSDFFKTPIISNDEPIHSWTGTGQEDVFISTSSCRQSVVTAASHCSELFLQVLISICFANLISL